MILGTFVATNNVGLCYAQLLIISWIRNTTQILQSDLVKEPIYMYLPMIGKNRQLGTNEPVGFEKEPVEVTSRLQENLPIILEECKEYIPIYK